MEEKCVWLFYYFNFERNYAILKEICLKEIFKKKNLRFVSVYNVLNTLSEYKYFYISKKTLLYTFFWLFFKSSKAFSVFLIKQDLFLLLFLMKNFLNKSAFNMLVWLVQILVSLWQARFYNSFILFIWIFNE